MNALIAHGLVRELYYGKRILVVTERTNSSRVAFEDLVNTFHEDGPKYGWGDLDKTVSMHAGYQLHKGEGFVAVRTHHQIRHAWRGFTFDYIVLDNVRDKDAVLTELAPTLVGGNPGKVISSW
jgi:hypothetical protein